jgi:hypothetical protein
LYIGFTKEDLSHKLDTTDPKADRIKYGDDEVAIVHYILIGAQSLKNNKHVHINELDISVSVTKPIHALDHPLYYKHFLADTYEKLTDPKASISTVIDIVDNDNLVAKDQYLQTVNEILHVRTRTDRFKRNGLYLTIQYPDTPTEVKHYPLDSLREHGIFPSYEEASTHGNVGLLREKELEVLKHQSCMKEMEAKMQAEESKAKMQAETLKNKLKALEQEYKLKEASYNRKLSEYEIREREHLLRQKELEDKLEALKQSVELKREAVNTKYHEYRLKQDEAEFRAKIERYKNTNDMLKVGLGLMGTVLAIALLFLRRHEV